MLYLSRRDVLVGTYNKYLSASTMKRNGPLHD